MAIFRHKQRSRALEADAFAPGGDGLGGPAAEPPRDHSAGGLLRETRESFKWELRDVAAALRIRAEYLDSLEHNTVEGLPGPTYAAGFLRAYAEYLGLDSYEIVRRFRTEKTGLQAASELAFPVPLTERGIPGGGIFLIALLICTLGYGAYYYYVTSGARPAEQAIAPPPAALLPPPPSPPQIAIAEPPKPAEAPASLTASASVPSAAPTTVPSAAPTTVPSAAPTAAPMPPAMPAPATIAPASPPPPTQISAADAPPAAAAPADLDPTKAASRNFGDATPGRIVIHATGKAWVVVKDGEKPILNRMLDKGDTYNAPDRKGLVMRTGSAGALELVVDGRTLPAIGPVGQVKTVLLDADKLARAVPPG